MRSRSSADRAGPLRRFTWVTSVPVDGPPGQLRGLRTAGSPRVAARAAISEHEPTPLLREHPEAPPSRESRMRNLIFRLVINAVAIYVAARVVTGIELVGTWVDVAVVALVFGLINALVKPIVKLITLPLLFLTLGLVTFVINAAMLGLTAALTDRLSVDGFLPALIGSIVISVVSMILSVLLDDGDD